MSFTATITKFGIQSGTEDTLYVAWSWPPSSSKKSSGAGGSSSGSITYYKAPSYSGYSIVDALARAGEKDTSLPHRQKIAVLNGYVSKASDWSGTNAQNGKMLKDLLAGKLIKSKSGSSTSSSMTTVPKTDHYRVVWQYKLDGIWYVLSDEEVKTKHSTASMSNNPYILEYRVRILPVPKKDATWSASWTAWKSYKPPYRMPAQAPAPNLSAPTGSTSSLRVVANVSGITDKLSTHIIFSLFVNEQKSKKSVAESPRVKIGTGSASYTFTGLKPSTNYVVRAKASYAYTKTVKGVKKTYYTDGEVSGFSSVYSTEPANQPAPKVVVERILEDASTAKLYVTWKKDVTARKYIIQATYDVAYFNNNDSSGIQSREFIDVTSTAARLFELQLNGHTTWYFRIVVENSLGQQSVPMSDKYYKKLVLGVKPAAPTTWTMTSSFMQNETIRFFWVHNSIDSSWQTSARIKLEFEDGGNPMVIKVDTPPSGRDPSLVQEPTYNKDLVITPEIAQRLESGTTIRWSVQTRGAYGWGSTDSVGYSDWSVVRAIDVYTAPSLTVDFVDGSGDHVQETNTAHAYPLNVTGDVTAPGQEFIGYDISITALEAYDIIDGTGHEISVNEGASIFQQHYISDGTTNFSQQILPGDALLQNGIKYALRVVVAFNSGLTAEQTITFYTDWDSIDTYIPSATVEFDEENICTSIYPICMRLVYDPLREAIMSTAKQTPESMDYDIAHGYTTNITSGSKDRYILTGTEPSDWNATYMYYLTYDGSIYTPVPESENPPTWAPNTYYAFEPGNQQFTIETDSDRTEVRVFSGYGSEVTGRFAQEGIAYLASSITLEETPERYDLTLSEPSDWVWNWNTYFTVEEYLTYEQIPMGDEVPEWEPDMYYKLVDDKYVLTLSEPSDWSTNYFEYFTKQVERSYESMFDDKDMPEWQPDTYYAYTPPITSSHSNATVRFEYVNRGGVVVDNRTFEIGCYDMASTEYALNTSSVWFMLNIYIEFTDLPPVSSFTFKMVSQTISSTPIAANVEMSIFRIGYDGKLQLIAGGIANDGLTVIRDPHPSLDFARYRVVATDLDSGTISFSDITPASIQYPNIVLQWDESWSSSNIESDMEGIAADNQFYSGERIILPYNIAVSESNSLDVSLVDYAGREDPVSYYGTKTGQSGTWSTVIPRGDVDTLYALRRLSVYRGDVYVREPSGIGYWANVAVSMNSSYDDLTIPISITVTRVDGGV